MSRSASTRMVIVEAPPLKFCSKNSMFFSVWEPFGTKSLSAKVVFRPIAAMAARIVTTMAPPRIGNGRRTMVAATRARAAPAPGIVSATGLAANAHPRAARLRSSTSRAAGTKVVITIHPDRTPIPATMPKSATGSNLLVRLVMKLTAVVPAASRTGTPENLTASPTATPGASPPGSSSRASASR